jgi:hypothetical protein
MAAQLANGNFIYTIYFANRYLAEEFPKKETFWQPVTTTM